VLLFIPLHVFFIKDSQTGETTTVPGEILDTSNLPHIGIFTVLWVIWCDWTHYVRKEVPKMEKPRKSYKTRLLYAVALLASTIVQTAQLLAITSLIWYVAVTPVNTICGAQNYGLAVCSAVTAILLSGCKQLSWVLREHTHTTDESYFSEIFAISVIDYFLEVGIDTIAAWLSLFISLYHSTSVPGILFNIYTVLWIADLDDVFIGVFFSVDVHRHYNFSPTTGIRRGLKKSRVPRWINFLTSIVYGLSAMGVTAVGISIITRLNPYERECPNVTHT